MEANHYSASRNQATGRWTGWMVYAGSRNIIETPDSYTTKREALAAIKEQHPE